MFQKMLRILVAISVILGIGFMSFAPAAQAIDDRAKTGFKDSVEEVGGSEASSVPSLLKSTISILLYVAGIVAVIIIVIGSIRFVTSEGDSAAATKARNSVIYALVGLILAVMAYVLVNFILEGL